MYSLELCPHGKTQCIVTIDRNTTVAQNLDCGSILRPAIIAILESFGEPITNLRSLCLRYRASSNESHAANKRAQAHFVLEHVYLLYTANFVYFFVGRRKKAGTPRSSRSTAAAGFWGACAGGSCAFVCGGIIGGCGIGCCAGICCCIAL